MQYNARAFNFIPFVFPRERTVACFLKLQRHSALPLLHIAIKRVAIALASVPQPAAPKQRACPVLRTLSNMAPSKAHVNRDQRVESFKEIELSVTVPRERNAIAYNKFVYLYVYATPQFGLLFHQFSC